KAELATELIEQRADAQRELVRGGQDEDGDTELDLSSEDDPTQRSIADLDSWHESTHSGWKPQNDVDEDQDLVHHTAPPAPARSQSGNQAQRQASSTPTHGSAPSQPIYAAPPSMSAQPSPTDDLHRADVTPPQSETAEENTDSIAQSSDIQVPTLGRADQNATTSSNAASTPFIESGDDLPIGSAGARVVAHDQVDDEANEPAINAIASSSGARFWLIMTGVGVTLGLVSATVLWLAGLIQ
ncbi:MAG: hypothetical protein ACI9MC_004151, partial [Kiritimatiellia bacterium]